MSLPEVLLTLRRDHRRTVAASAEAALGQAHAFSGKKAVEAYIKSLFSTLSTDPEETANPATLARSVGIPAAR